MPSVVQLPLDRTPAVQVGPRTFRKRILREGTIPYNGRELTYTRDDLAKYAQHFRAGAYQQVPVMAVDADNRHSNDPERYRGEVKSMELTPEGLDAVVELTEDGAKVVRENPRLGVSPRIVEDAEHVPHVPAIQHVALTLDPRVRDLGEWIATDLSADGVPSAVVDLTASQFMADNTQATAEPQPLSPEEVEQFRALAARASTSPTSPGSPAEQAKVSEQADPTAPVVTTEARPSLMNRLLGRTPDAPNGGEPGLTDEQLTTILADPASAPATTAPAGATLSAEDRQAIELAASQAQTAQAQADAANAALRASTVAAERERYIQSGAPPAIFDLAAPILSAPAAAVELSGGQSVDARETVRKMLDEVQGFIELSGLTGTVEVSEDADRKAKLEAWEAASG